MPEPLPPSPCRMPVVLRVWLLPTAPRPAATSWAREAAEGPPDLAAALVSPSQNSPSLSGDEL